MARLRKPEESTRWSSSDIPAELLDHDSEVWVDREMFRQWTEDVSGQRLSAVDRTPYDRFTEAATSWATRNGFESERWPGLADWTRLAELGIKRMPSLKRAELNWRHGQRYGPGTEPWVTVKHRSTPV